MQYMTSEQMSNRASRRLARLRQCDLTADWFIILFPVRSLEHSVCIPCFVEQEFSISRPNKHPCNISVNYAMHSPLPRLKHPSSRIYDNDTPTAQPCTWPPLPQ
jgi:hypothetical protein